jgi:hypothetical protein
LGTAFMLSWNVWGSFRMRHRAQLEMPHKSLSTDGINRPGGHGPAIAMGIFKGQDL